MSRFSSFKFSILTTAVMSIFAAASVYAEPINVTSERGVIVGDLVHGDFQGSDSPSSSIGAFVDGVTQTLGGPHTAWNGTSFETHEVTSANQDSILQPSAGIFAGTGDASIGFSVLDSDLVFAKSFFDVSFDIATNHSYALAGNLYANMDGGQGLALFKLDGPNSLNSLMFEAVNWDDLTLNSVGTLAAGHYHLVMSALVNPACEPINCSDYSYMGGSSSFDVNFQVTEVTAAVPEPEIYALLGVGLGLMGWVGHRRKQQAA